MKKRIGKTPPTTVRIRPDIKESLRALAEEENRTPSNLLVTLVEEGIKRRKRRKGTDDGTVHSN